MVARFRTLKHPADIFGRFAAGALHAYVARSVQAQRWRHIAIGKGAQVHRGTLLHTNDAGTDRRIVIGDRSFVGQNCFFSAGELIELEQDCLIGPSCNLLGAGHLIDDPTRSYAASPIVNYGKIVVEANCWIGTACTIIGDVRVGFGSIVAAGSLLRESVPPLCMVAGNPGRIRKLFDWKNRIWNSACAGSEIFEESMRCHEQKMPSREQFIHQLSRSL